jgi:hypothetical protein
LSVAFAVAASYACAQYDDRFFSFGGLRGEQALITEYKTRNIGTPAAKGTEVAAVSAWQIALVSQSDAASGLDPASRAIRRRRR